MKCPNCGKDNPDSAKFCGYCGTNMTAGAAAASAAPQPEAAPPPAPPAAQVRPAPPPPTFAEARKPAARPAAPAQGEVVQPRQARLEQIPRVESGGQRMRGGYPPPRQPQARMGGMDKSNQQRMIIIGAAVLVLLFVVICAVVAFVQREALMDTATGIFDPSGRETQVQLDIQMGLTQTAAVSVDIPATVQAQIALTQTAVSAAAPPAAQQPPAEQPPAADAAETQYVQAVKDGITAYNTAMSKIDELLNAAQADANKLNDEQWKSEFSSATANVTQTSDSLRQLSPPQRMADIQPDVVEAATNLDNAVKLLTEYITDKNAEKVTQAAEAKTKGNDAINKVQQKIQALGL